MSNGSCSQCGDPATIWLGGGDPRCEDCPPETCERCNEDLTFDDNVKPWEWEEYCESCLELKQKDVWCEHCESDLIVDEITYDGVKIACDCSSCYIPIDLLAARAPYSWKYDGRHGTTRLNR